MYNKSSVTSLRINPQLRDLFEGTKTLHNKSLSDALEDGLLLTLKTILPVAILENQIEETRNRLMDLESSLSYAKRIEEETKKKLDKRVDTGDIFTEVRENIFSDDSPGSILRMLKKHQSPAWDRVYMKYGFRTAKEMELFVRQEAMQRGII